MISAMNSVSSNVRNMDQADKLSGLLSDVTSVSTELTDKSKVILFLANLSYNYLLIFNRSCIQVNDGSRTLSVLV